jgi:prepilin-type N-terminal cleavage/methylation domain-containing protein
MRNVRRAARGFTLIEVMIVAMLIGVLASIAIPFYQKMTARAHRSEVPVILNKLRQYFVNLYNDSGSYAAKPGGQDMTIGHNSAWNPITSPGPGGQWLPHGIGWEDMPFPPEGNIKLRYQYSVEANDQMTFYVCGIFPGFGDATQPCGKVGDMLGNYAYQESLAGVTTTGVAEFPAPGF